jgi:hypothetical protein
MKNALLLFTLAVNISFSQITINSTHLPNSGDSLRVSIAVQNPSIDFAATGEDFVWNFTSLLESASSELKDYKPVPPTDQFLNVMFGQFAPQKYRASYFLPNNTLPITNLGQFLPINFERIDQFFKLYPDSLTQIGYSFTIEGQAIPTRSDTIETIYHFPIEYGNEHSSRGYTKLDLNPFQNAIWIQYRQRQTVVDGWGQLSTVFGTFPVLRIHHTIQERDSLYIDFNGTGFWIPVQVPTAHEYEWRSTSEKECLLKIFTSEGGGNENITRIEYRDFVNLGILENEISVSIYPNPAKDLLAIESAQAFQSYKIYSLEGKLITSASNVNSFYSLISVDSLSQGSYFLELAFENGISRKKFVKE